MGEKSHSVTVSWSWGTLKIKPSYSRVCLDPLSWISHCTAISEIFFFTILHDWGSANSKFTFRKLMQKMRYVQSGWVNCAGETWGQVHGDYRLNWSQRLSPLTFPISDFLMLPLPLSHCINSQRSWNVPQLLTKKDLCGKVKEDGGGDRQFMERKRKELEKPRNRRNIRGIASFPNLSGILLAFLPLWSAVWSYISAHLLFK